MITFTYDPEVKMAYVKVSERGVNMTVPAGSGVNFDLDADGNLVGVEIFA
ncbi:DUF2283 domain-containing protein [Cryobacterium sp. Sr8]|nr:DUF2283 domain-containing protein [Cryobacterium sp. Sr8]